MTSEGFQIWYQEFWNKFDKREKEWEMHEKKNWHQKSIKICLKLPTEKKILAKDAYNKNWTRKSFFKKATSKRPAKSFWIEKIEKKRKWEIFQQMKNAAETKSISQNSNKIIQKKYQTFLSLYLQKIIDHHRQIVLPDSL